ncbi:NAD(P)-binding Rossmann-fold containing protein [Glarea lozoyensis ATCC 20868]|uniref:NAD(P)-binding Rossmann-fold containing protein n=1 Tax=Glarea lozoyensis (strain ATCC 20868 / MF5171) TaxID=1116229 RepID=S3D481_GLAL2|nr:NAD(P)-binding Rossmann-fold containing protein [Glarea lozoyensis ATCC 20868]EPE33257.1 NAD(P)-binding Rossmann-fold containing protein [Glarea lozoyensis ATCC 20868]
MTDAVLIAYYRGRAMIEVRQNGGMAAIGLGSEAASEFLRDGVVVACDNSPESVTLSGDISSLQAMMRDIESAKPAVFVKQLRVEMAYHSYHMRGIGKDYGDLLDTMVVARKATVPFYSSVSGRLKMGHGVLGAAYWRSNLESPVLFNSAVNSYLKDNDTDTIFVEVGPHSTLAGPLRQIFKAANVNYDVSYASCLERRKNCSVSMLNLAGTLWQRDITLDLSILCPENEVLTDIPNYPWSRDTKYWNENRAVRQWRCREYPRHELLGTRIIESIDREPSWRVLLNLEDTPWIRDHRVGEDIVFPAAGYIAMAGEATRQLSSVSDYTMQNILISTALVMKEGETHEIVTSLKPSRLTDSLDSVWYDFSISSFSGTWLLHCSGQIKAGGAEEKSEIHQPLSRKISSPYHSLKSIGLNYGPCFQGLANITTRPGAKIAFGTILAPTAFIQDAYQLHPTSIDCCLQLFMLGASEGVSRRLDRLYVPTEIDYLYVGQADLSGDLQAIATATTVSTARINGHATVTTNDSKVVLSLEGGQFSSIENDVATTNNIAGAEIYYAPDIDLYNAESLIRPRGDSEMLSGWLSAEELCMLCMIEMMKRARPASLSLPHLEDFYSWIASQIEPLDEENHISSQSLKKGQAMNSGQRLEKIEQLSQEISSSKASAVSNLVKRVFDDWSQLVQGQVEPLEILLPDDGLTKFYNVLEGLTNYSDFFATLGHNNPGLRILEIGAGTGGTTSAILKALTTPNGTRMYGKYSYTDVSSGFFVAAKERFKEFANIEYSVLDISKDPISQGFPVEEFDLIIAANVLHATPNLNATLKNVRKLIAPSGRLYLQELSPSMMRPVNFIMGILPGWWLGANDGRSLEPFISTTRWDQELRKSGFLGTETVVLDNDAPYNLNANIIARPEPTITTNGYNRTISILGDPQNFQQLIRLFEHRGYDLQCYSTCDRLPANQDIISCLELSNPFFDDIDSANFAQFQKIARHLQNSRLLWLTKSSQNSCIDPRFSLVLGLARTLRAETSVDFNTLEIDKLDEKTFEHVVAVFDKIRHRHTDPTASEIDPDYEFVLSNGVVQVGRYHAVTVPSELPVPTEATAPKSLTIGKLGLLQSLSWEQRDVLPELGDDDVEVELRCVGLNFRDVLTCMGIVESSIGGLGLEASAIVRKLGKNVRDLAIGDRVMVFGSGCFSTKRNISSFLCAKIPDNVGDEEAATMPTVYSTVIHSLINLGGLQEGQTVLIHSACGGVGLAAIQLCRYLGAEVYVSAGNEEKVAYLQNQFDIPRNRIFHSRDDSFLSNLMRETNGKGVDLVLNSLSGELLHASWKCVAEGGRFIELGKRDFIGRGKLNMDIFEDNRAFFGVDLNRFTPKQCKPLLEKTAELLREGHIKPINPRKVFEYTEAEEAFRYMQKGIHIGKVLVKMPEPGEHINTRPLMTKIALHEHKTFILIGGLGGLGRAISTWMIERGARHFIYLSRSAGSEKDLPFIQELEAQKCSIQTIAGSVANMADVKRAIAAAKSPIGGILQMSMVLRDQLFAEHDFEDWRTVVDPKVKGTWNLHHALEGHDLDFFVLFSSISGIVGTKGQTAYAAANTFLDSFVLYRHGLGLPASAIDIGMMTEIGYVAETKALHGMVGAKALHALRETDLIDALQLSIASNSSVKKSTVPGIRNASSLVIGLRPTKPLDDPTDTTPWKHDRRMSLYHDVSSGPTQSTSSSNDNLRAFLGSVETTPSTLDSAASFEFLARLIGTQLYVFMMHPIEDLDFAQTLSGLGVDSLVTLEVRNWWKRSLGVDVSTLEILGAGTIEGLAKLAGEGLKRKYGESV